MIFNILVRQIKFDQIIHDLFLAVIAVNITFLARVNRAPVKVAITSVKITGFIDIMIQLSLCDIIGDCQLGQTSSHISHPSTWDKSFLKY